MKFITLAGLSCFVSTMALGQQPPDPAQPNPAQQAPAQQAPPPQAPTPLPEPSPPPKPVAAPQNPRDIAAKPDNTPPDDIDNVFVSAKVYYWLTKGTFNLLSGAKATSAGGSTLPTLGDASKHNLGGVITFPAGKYNRLEVSFYQAHGNGTSTAPQTLTFFGQTIPAGDFLSTSFRVRQIKATWNYLTWPAPPEASRLRIKTLWELQYTQVSTVIDAPYETSATFSPATGTLHIIYPSFGLGGEYVLSKYLYLDSRISGFAWPHHAVIWDAEGDVVARYKFLELFGGYKASHLKTSPQGEEFAVGTFQGGYVGLRIALR